MISQKAADFLLEKNIISIDGEVNGEMVGYVRRSIGSFYTKGSPDILILIDSNGGSVSAGLDIYDMLSLYPGEKTAVVVSAAYSMAAVILQGCSKRMATKHAWILVHNINSRSVKLDVLRDEKKLADLCRTMEKDQEKLYNIIEKRTGKPRDVVLAAFAKDEPMTTDDALLFGLLDGIWDKPLPK